MTYSDKLKDPRWQKKRLEILSRDNFKCCLCADERTTLHVHHLKYKKGKNPWEYENKYLQTLCADCHKLIEVFKKNNAWFIEYVTKVIHKDSCKYIVKLFSDDFVIIDVESEEYTVVSLEEIHIIQKYLNG